MSRSDAFWTWTWKQSRCQCFSAARFLQRAYTCQKGFKTCFMTACLPNEPHITLWLDQTLENPVKLVLFLLKSWPIQHLWMIYAVQWIERSVWTKQYETISEEEEKQTEELILQKICQYCLCRSCLMPYVYTISISVSARTLNFPHDKQSVSFFSSSCQLFPAIEGVFGAGCWRGKLITHQHHPVVLHFLEEAGKLLEWLSWEEKTKKNYLRWYRITQRVHSFSKTTSSIWKRGSTDWR